MSYPKRHVLDPHRKLVRAKLAAHSQDPEEASDAVGGVYRLKEAEDFIERTNLDAILTERSPIINKLYAIYDKALQLGHLPDPAKLEEIGINIKRLPLYHYGYPGAYNSGNDDYYFQPMEHCRLDSHPLLPVDADDMPATPRVKRRANNRTNHPSSIFSQPGRIANALNWYFAEGIRDDPHCPDYPLTLIEASLWREPEDVPEEHVFGRRLPHSIPRHYGSGQKWFVDKIYVASHEGHPHESFVVCHDHQWVLDENHPAYKRESDPRVTLLHGELKVILQAMITRYSEEERPEILRHQVMPIQIISIIGDRARILQAHYNNRELVVRRSLFIDPLGEDPITGTSWYDLFTRYLAAEPLGDTTEFPPTTPPTPPKTPGRKLKIHPTGQPQDEWPCLLANLAPRCGGLNVIEFPTPRQIVSAVGEGLLHGGKKKGGRNATDLDEQWDAGRPAFKRRKVTLPDILN
ncbi:hypothetical protein BJY01DRAFT_249279 [Aspergillus pseudoustus]|uniref:Uncharacterized protein n=1 Tax=Aspergillus pseudoustus TaxID=1810923 RepID=A0ABR4JPS9_9EURO